MKPRLAAAAVILLWLVSPASAHRLDEYLQAATLDVGRSRVAVQVRLTPGVEAFGQVFAALDADGDGVVSADEQQRYAERVRSDVSLTLDGARLPLRTLSAAFPKPSEMKEGLGDIVLNFQADVPGGGNNPDRKITFENRHLRSISVYLVNCLVPRDPGIRITAQDRNYDQSFYQLSYTQTDPRPGPAPLRAGPNGPVRTDSTGSTSLFKAFFYQGVHHILTGYDHLLFVGALVLAATTLWDLIKVVSAFTLAHTITLTLAVLNVIHLPGRVVEPLISASIVCVALQNVFWPSRARGWSRLGAAFFFGLFHGMGFAGGLLEAMREMQSTTMLLAILAFSIGIEAGHQMVVLPLFALLKAARHTQPDAVLRTRVSMTVQRIGSAGISAAGVYYLCLALAGKS